MEALRGMLIALTPLTFSSSVKDVVLGPQSLAHFTSSQSILELNGKYAFSDRAPRAFLHSCMTAIPLEHTLPARFPG